MSTAAPSVRVRFLDSIAGPAFVFPAGAVVDLPPELAESLLASGKIAESTTAPVTCKLRCGRCAARTRLAPATLDDPAWTPCWCGQVRAVGE